MTQVATEVRRASWERFLDASQDATIYHSPEWRELLVRSFGHRPHYLFCTEDSDEIKGMLPLVQVKSIFGSRLSSLPLAHTCYPLGDDATKYELVEAAVQLSKKLNCKTLEMKGLVNCNGFTVSNIFSTFTMELSNDIVQLKSRLNRQLRRALTKSLNSGVTVERTTEIEHLKEFFELNCMTKRKFGVPCHPWSYFKNMFAILKNHCALYVAKYRGQVIAGGIMEYFKNDVIYACGAADDKYLKVYPYDAFLWQSISDAALKGFKCFDFGTCSRFDTGLINYKKKWGTTELKLYYSYYPFQALSPLKEGYDGDSLFYRLGKNVLRHMPEPAYKKVSNVAFGRLV
jgi:hypothetical protein